ncbi:MAG TPA: tetratricopeptide repeat protein [Burkholderiaceae bacterium]|jgi:predicted O-linked N-acetylglucosamine transferase (SPINDLY family)
MSVGRNDPCPCGSGKKYKQCCLAREAAGTRAQPMQRPDAGQLMSAAWQCMQYGDLQQAAILCAQALAIRPKDAEVLHLSGLVAAQTRRFDDALVLLGRACATAPKQPAFHTNFGNLHMQMKDYAKAEACFRKALSLDPGLSDVHNNLGYALLSQKRHADAAMSFRRALKLAPDNVSAHLNLFNLLHENKDWISARQAVEALLKVQPNNPLAYFSSGLLEQAVGEFALAESHYRQAIAMQPQFSSAHSNLGDVLMANGRWQEAEQCYRTALHIEPGLIEAKHHLGLVLQNQGRLSDALACIAELVQLRPDSPEIQINLGNLCKDIGDIDGALASYRKVLSIRPNDADAWDNLLFVLNYIDSANPEMIYAEHRYWGERFEVAAPAMPAVRREKHQRIRIGYVSGDFKHHPVAYFLESVLAHYDRSRFEVTCYAFNAQTDDVTERLRAYVDHWRSLVNVDDIQAAELVRQDGIDILIDLSGHTAGNRLDVFIRKPAPIQISWLGYGNTTGMARMDYVISDPVSSPADDQQRFSEKLLRLPQVRLCYRAPDYLPDVASLPSMANGFITFGCFNNINKLNSHVLTLWAQILSRLPHSVLRLKSKYFIDPATCERFQQFFAMHNIAPIRLHLSQQSSHRQMLEEYAEIDIALDPFPYSGGTTTCEALCCGVPVLTLRGDCMYGRQSASFLSAAQLDDWIAETEADYVDKALAFASDQSGLAQLRSQLRRRMNDSPVADAANFTRNFEALLLQTLE